MTIDILNSNLDLKNIIYPKNIYALRIKDGNENIHDIAVEHNGFCPDIFTEIEQSKYNDYLSNLEYSAVQEYFKSIKKRKPKVYISLIEVMTNEKGELYHYAYSVK